MPHQPTLKEIRLNVITTCLTFSLPLLDELNEAFRPPFVQSITNTIQTLINSVQNVKQNKSECAQLIENIHQVLYAIVNLHMKSEPFGSLPPSMLDNVGKFLETLHKIYIFIEAQEQRNKIKHFFRNNEMKTLLQDCHAGLKQAQEVFGIETQTQTLLAIKDFKMTSNLMHQELMALIEKLSDTSTVSESSNSFSMLPSKPKIFHGRETELNHILELISQKPLRIAILGGGGMGKTSLARAVLHHPDTCSKFGYRFFVSAEAATTSVELAALIGLHVGLDPGQNLTKSVVQYFSKQVCCLLILDNLETVWEPIQSRTGVEEFLSLLTGLEQLALVITMRGAERPAKVQWTHPFLLPLKPLSNDAARQTFAEITDNSNITEEIDQLLGFTDNMPLAVDLMAHLADYEGVSNVLARWETEKTSLLSVGFDRQSSVDASINLSLSSPRITSGSKELLSLLSILPNGLSETELVQINLGIPNILTCKAALEGTSLIYWDNNQRLMLLMPIREFIQKIIPPSQSHVQLIRHYLYGVLRRYSGQKRNLAEIQITLNLGNLQEILKLGLHPDAPTVAETIKLTGRNHVPLLDNVQSLLSQLCDHQLETFLLIEFLSTPHYATRVSEEAIAQAIIHVDCNNDADLSGRLYNALGSHLFYYGSKCDTQRAIQFLHKAQEMSELCGNSTLQCSVLIKFGWFEWRAGNYSAGIAYANTAQRVSKLSANLVQEVLAHQLGAICSRDLGNYQKSAALLDRATKLVPMCDMSGGTIDNKIKRDQAEIHLLKSEYMEARNIFLEVTKSTSPEQNSASHAIALLNIALIDTVIQETGEDVYNKLNTVREITRHLTQGIVFCDIVQAILELREGKFNTAWTKFQKCLQSTWGTSRCLEQLANIKAWPSDKWKGKWPIIYLAHAHRSNRKLDLHKALLFLGDAFIVGNDKDTATNLFQIALAGFTQMGVHHSQAQCMLRLGDLATQHGHTSEAITLWKAARPLLECSVAKDVFQIESRLANLERDSQEALLKLDTLHAPIQLPKETSELEIKHAGKEVAEEQEHMVPVIV
ncbi:hypothetical protein K438DRAFT_1787256 [Mycena galopus ATCC 62051]|nr:hypothetical protein K438DRAFT_1787256 [Mycena galopus ATCC 62051]